MMTNLSKLSRLMIIIRHRDALRGIELYVRLKIHIGTKAILRNLIHEALIIDDYEDTFRLMGNNVRVTLYRQYHLPYIMYRNRNMISKNRG